MAAVAAVAAVAAAAAAAPAAAMAAAVGAAALERDEAEGVPGRDCGPGGGLPATLGGALPRPADA